MMLVGDNVDSVELNVATVNVRFDGKANTPVPIPDTGVIPPQKHRKNWIELPWSERRSRLVDCLLSTGPLDIIGFQEVLNNQLHDLQTLLGPNYKHVGVGRDDGKTAGEYSPIFYNSTRFEEIGWKTIWLSKTPEVPGSKDWDAIQTRIATLLALRQKQDGAMIHVMNTHYDDGGSLSRSESSYIIRQESYAYFKRIEAELGEQTSTIPIAVILMGDFNSPTNEGGYKNITSLKPVPSGRSAYNFFDTYTYLQTRSSSTIPPRQSAPYGPEKTFTDFGQNTSSVGRIDFVFLGEDALATDGRKWVATRYACLDNYVEGDSSGWKGRWSDHRAVRVKLELL